MKKKNSTQSLSAYNSLQAADCRTVLAELQDIRSFAVPVQLSMLLLPGAGEASVLQSIFLCFLFWSKLIHLSTSGKLPKIIPACTKSADVNEQFEEYKSR